MTHALVIDDEPAICRCFETLFADLNCEVSVAASAEAGLQVLEERAVNVVVLDVRLPGMDGVTALPRIREFTAAPIIVMTAHGTLSTAISIAQEGAFEYLPKPFDLDQVSKVLQRALAQSVSQTEQSETIGQDEETSGIIGGSLPMQNMFRQIALAAQHDAPVLITGESGTGKELVAHAIHQHSQRRDAAIVPVHLASLNDSLMERELFGHTTGAFTGATSGQAGLVIRADGGTLFLDEIGEASPSIQVKLLRLLESGDFYRVGSATPERSNFRLIAATNRPLEYLKNSETFREDFYYRLSAIQIQVPSLRDRVEDIPRLAKFFLNQINPDAHRTFTQPALQVLQSRSYPGNVRELRNLVLQIASASQESEISADSIHNVSNNPTHQPKTDNLADSLIMSLRSWTEHALRSNQTDLLATVSQMVEQELIQATLEHVNGNRTAAAQRLGIHRETLREKIAKLQQDTTS